MNISEEFNFRFYEFSSQIVKYMRNRLYYTILEVYSYFRIIFNIYIQRKIHT